MAKHKVSEDVECPNCKGTGKVCSVCERADGDCTCEDGPADLEDCPQCDGTGHE